MSRVFPPMDDVIMDLHLGMDSSLLANQHLHNWNQGQGNTEVNNVYS